MSDVDRIHRKLIEKFDEQGDTKGSPLDRMYKAGIIGCIEAVEQIRIDDLDEEPEEWWMVERLWKIGGRGTRG